MRVSVLSITFNIIVLFVSTIDAKKAKKGFSFLYICIGDGCTIGQVILTIVTLTILSIVGCLGLCCFLVACCRCCSDYHGTCDLSDNECDLADNEQV